MVCISAWGKMNEGKKERQNEEKAGKVGWQEKEETEGRGWSRI